MSLSALLFDLDGTLADSDPLHFRAFLTAARNWGADFDEDYFATHMSGHSNREICEALLPGRSAEDHRGLADEKEALFRATVGQLQPIPGLRRLLEWARDHGLALAVVSNAPRANITAIVDAFGIADVFSVLVSGEELGRGKPDPLPYVTALEHLGVTAEQAVAFEDATPGLTAAVHAGIATVGVLTSHPAETLMRAGAAITVADFADPALLPFLRARM
ncbi:MAG: HAD family hydrolase [Bacteroidota bacterium]